MIQHGTVTHKGNRYDLERLLATAESRPIGSVSVHSLNWIIGSLTNPCGSCKHGPDSWHEERITSADLNFPILVLSDNAVHYVLDGLHRLIKANREAVGRLPCKWLFPSDLYKATVSSKL